MSLVYYVLFLVVVYNPDSPYKLPNSEAEFDAKFQTRDSCEQAGKGLLNGLSMVSRPDDNFETKRSYHCSQRVIQIVPNIQSVHRRNRPRASNSVGAKRS